jgi:hypothetical protein
VEKETISIWDLPAFKNMDPETCTPEWNIAHYTKLLSYTGHSVRRKKLLQELKWWQDAKKWREEAEKLKASE